MTRIFCLLPLVCLTALLEAQSLEVLNPVTTVPGTLAELGTNGNLEASWVMRNNSSDEISVRASRNVVEGVQGAENYFCWGVCFTSSVDVSPVQAAVTMGAGEENSSFFGHYKPNGNDGQAAIEYCFFRTDNESDRVCHTVYYCVDVDCVVGVGERALSPATLESYPNPAVGLAKMAYRLPEGTRGGVIRWYSASGQMVREEAVNDPQGVLILSGLDFEPGVYQVTMGNGSEVFAVSRFAVIR